MGCTEIDSGPDLSHGLQACHRLLQTVPLKEKRKHDFIHSIVDRHLGVNVVCSSHTGVILVLLTFPTPACKLLFLCLSLGQGLLESSPRHYLLDQSQPGCEKGGLLNGETVAGKGGAELPIPGPLESAWGLPLGPGCGMGGPGGQGTQPRQEAPHPEP